MDDCVRQARRDREACEDFLAANPTQWNCTVIRRPIMSYKPEVFVDGQWASNALAFRTEKEALLSAHELMSRWLKVEDYRAVESEQAVNYEIVDGVMYPVIPEKY